ncbi:YceI family protein [Leptospira fluminis]|uniref:YceI family protein n=1 Tax=Leptospira fluminis TaxID=2484979 RepID=A0A4R9GQX0_9LEPT|nr:YceI family protein [Leptospira fluminis]TGK18755.1 YceI family protein [Leptospira fluminis]
MKLRTAKSNLSAGIRFVFFGLILSSILLLDWQSKTEAAPQPGICKFTLDPEKTSVEWRAFKFTEKTGVGGKFTKIRITGFKTGKSPEEALRGFKFFLEPIDLDSANPERDAKIKGAFFGALKDGGKISGHFVSVKFDATGNAGTGVVKLTMNGISRDVHLNFTLENGDLLKTKGTVLLKEWKAEHAVSALNQVCKDLHTGKDGKSVLWPEVDVSITSVYLTKCD